MAGQPAAPRRTGVLPAPPPCRYNAPPASGFCPGPLGEIYIIMVTNIINALDRLTDLGGRILALLTLLLTATLFITVLMRYGFRSNALPLGDLSLSRQALEESVLYMHCILFMLASAYTLRSDGHVRVDVFYRRFSPRNRAIVDLAGSLFLLLPMAGFILYSSLDYVSFAWKLKEKSQEASGLPWVYLLKTLIPLMGALLIGQALVEALRNLARLLGWLPLPATTAEAH